MTADLNIIVAGALDDMAALQASPHARKAYERAARAVALLEQSVADTPRSALAANRRLGPSARRIIDEFVAKGESVTLRRAGEVSGSRHEIDRRRSLREGFLSLAAARQVLQSRAPSGSVGAKVYRGDLQMHSTWSDGSRSIGEMALGCIERGYRFMAVTDHSQGLSIARGLSTESLATQHREIDALNDSLGGRFRILKGIEANILIDGRLDVAEDARRRCDIVLGAPHSKLDDDANQTARLIGAVQTPGVHVLAHPGGRKFGKRAGLKVNWDRVFRAAVTHDVAIEIDGDPSRQDLPYHLVGRALEAGCVFAIDSDAHDADELVFAEIALAHARLAGVPASRVINTWPISTLSRWLRRKTLRCG